MFNFIKWNECTKCHLIIFFNGAFNVNPSSNLILTIRMTGKLPRTKMLGQGKSSFIVFIFRRDFWTKRRRVRVWREFKPVERKFQNLKWAQFPINFGFPDKLGTEIEEICSKGLTQKSRRTVLYRSVHVHTHCTEIKKILYSN